MIEPRLRTKRGCEGFVAEGTVLVVLWGGTNGMHSLTAESWNHSPLATHHPLTRPDPHSDGIYSVELSLNQIPEAKISQSGGEPGPRVSLTTRLSQNQGAISPTVNNAEC